MIRVELGQRIVTKADGIISVLTHSNTGRYTANGETLAVVHYRGDAEQAGILVNEGLPAIGHGRDIVHLYKDGKVVKRFKMGQPPMGVNSLSKEEVNAQFNRTGGMQN